MNALAQGAEPHQGRTDYKRKAAAVVIGQDPCWDLEYEPDQFQGGSGQDQLQGVKMTRDHVIIDEMGKPDYIGKTARDYHYKINAAGAN